MDTQFALVSSAATSRSRAKEAQLAQRIFLYADELYRVPPVYRQARTRQGVAHISHGGRDFIVHSGESINLARAGDVALVSPLSGESLVLELFA